MILADTGPFVALFDPADSMHERCQTVLKNIREPMATTVAVLTEAFHMLSPASRGSDLLREFITRGGVRVWFMDMPAVERSFELMETYGDHPMDFADASLVTAAEALRTRRIFTIDRRDFESYRIRLGHRQYRVEIIS